MDPYKITNFFVSWKKHMKTLYFGVLSVAESTVKSVSVTQRNTLESHAVDIFLYWNYSVFAQ